MSVPAATFLAGAKGRLLPVSLIFRFFLAAALFHIALWSLLAWGAAGLSGFVGGPGTALAAVHALTLGVLVMTAMGAALQLLSVATKAPIAADGLARFISWVYILGSVALIAGMARAHIPLMMGGGIAVGLGLLLFGGIIADNLRRAQGMGVVVAHCWVAVVSLALLVILGLVLIADFHHGFLPDHSGLAVAHFLLAAFGFMGFLALGFSHVLVPMFTLAPQPSAPLGYASAALGATGLVLAVSGTTFGGTGVLTTGGGILGLAGAGLYLWLMGRALKVRMRKRLGLSFVLVRIAWVMLPAGILLLLISSIRLVPNAATLAGFTVLFGWLLTFLMGIFQRILPFLALMHGGGQGSSMPAASELAASPLLKLHAACHLAALGIIAGAIVSGDDDLLRIGGAIGLVGALTFAAFAINVVRLMISSRGEDPAASPDTSRDTSPDTSPDTSKEVRR